MLEGLMQHDHPLTVQHIVDRMRRLYWDSEVVTLGDEGARRASYGDVAARVDRLCGALTKLGIAPGDRVATFAWNSQEHLEVYLAAPSMGAVLHTLNIRLAGDQLTYIANHAEDRIVFVDDSLVPVLEPIAATFETVEHFVVMGDGDAGSLPNVLRYEELLAEAPEAFDYPELDDRAAAGLCYTSGTTGNPKGVLYSHRSQLLHGLSVCIADNLGLRSTDRVLPVVPMFHANAWGLAHAAPLTGADLVMPSRFLQGEPLAKLIESERVTVAGGVPTIWLDLLNYADANQPDMSSLRTVACGGSAVPLSLMQAFHERHGVDILQAWGMTETSPVAAVAHPPKGASEDEAWAARAKAGRPLPLVEARIVDDAGEEVAWDGEATGELEVRGPWIARSYYNDPSGDDKFDDGWLRTGDVAAIDGQGFIRIADRAKDVIKSGGEWVSSVDLEIALMAHEGVAEAAVIAKPDERWSERPLACVVRKEGSDVSAEELCGHLSERVAKWWIPDEFAFIGEVPKTSVGKFDKKVLRRQLSEGELEGRVEVDRKAKEPA
ncbi:MAG TPA: long-chain fatty acid--CoA ligase [Thermoleophilaceae bacterium]|nr:long-chain fatty acid--CoA ligase [Thermoleophilaceae bacterium]